MSYIIGTIRAKACLSAFHGQTKVMSRARVFLEGHCGAGEKKASNGPEKIGKHMSEQNQAHGTWRRIKTKIAPQLVEC